MTTATGFAPVSGFVGTEKEVSMDDTHTVARKVLEPIDSMNTYLLTIVYDALCELPDHSQSKRDALTAHDLLYDLFAASLDAAIEATQTANNGPVSELDTWLIRSKPYEPLSISDRMERILPELEFDIARCMTRDLMPAKATA